MSTLTEGKSSGSDKSAGDPSPNASGDAKGIGDRWQALGSDSRRTTIFIAVAIGCLLITGLFEWASRPAEIEEFGKVGQEFYPEFTDPTVATSLSVKVIDADELKPLEFSVKQAESGRWVIPSHHNYPADAADQLAATASSIIGIKRGAMVTRWASDHTRYGVVDPETESVGVDEIDGIGKRLTLRGEDDTILASYIIGKKVEGEGSQFYVRHPGEDETYIAELDISLSTKFSDWVQTKLLDVANTDVRRIVLNDYSFEERGRSLAVTKTVVSTLQRESSDDDWKMDLINEQTQELNADAIRETVNAVADLEIAGVRPKLPGLTADLQLDRNALKSQRDLDRLQSDLLSRGFLLQPSTSDPDALRLISREGEMSVGNKDGLVYQLHFGRVFTGSDEELEIGLGSDDESAEDNEQASDADDDSSEESSEEEESTEDDSEAGGKPGRYVFIRAEVDPTLFGEEPKPVEPEMSAELIEAEKKAAEQAEDGGDKPAEDSSDEASSDEASSDESTDDESTDDESTDDESTDDESTDDESTDDESTDDESTTEEAAEDQTDDAGEADEPTQGDEPDEAADSEPDEAADPEPAEAEQLQTMRDAYNQAKQQYAADVQALQEYKSKVEQAQEKAEELNRRFAQWYYVIPGESYDKLSLSREDLVQAKEAAEVSAPELKLDLPSVDNPGGPLPITPPAPASEPEGEPASEPEGEPASEPKGEPASEPKGEPASEPEPAEVKEDVSDPEPAPEEAAAEIE